MIDAVVAVVFHRYDNAPLAVNVVLLPVIIETLAGEINIVGNGLIVIVITLLYTVASTDVEAPLL